MQAWHARLPAAFRHGFANLYRPGNQARSVLVALGIGVMFTLTTYLLQRTVLRQVQNEGPGREGNLFMLDIRNAAEVSKLVESQPGVTGKVQLVGYIVSRMLEQNGVPVERLPLSIRRKDRFADCPDYKRQGAARWPSSEGGLVVGGGEYTSATGGV